MLAYIFRKLNDPGDGSGDGDGSGGGSEIDPEVFEKIVASGGAAGDLFGYSVAVSADGSTVVVGVPFDDDKGVNFGAVYVFTKEADGSYLETKKLTVSDGAYFGFSVAVSINSLVVSAPRNPGKGAVFVY